MRTVFLFLVLLFAGTAAANPVSCTNGGLSRSVEVVYSDPGQAVPCEVIYNKTREGAGIHSLWRASNETGYCEAKAAAFVDKLSAMGWDCSAAAAPGDVTDPEADPGSVSEDAPAELPIAPEPA